MPIQHTVFGRPIALHALPRRFVALFGFVGLFIFSLVLFGPPTSVDVPSVEDLKNTITHPKVPSVPNRYNPFAPSPHKPLEQPNSTHGDSKWLTDWKWRNPFSSTITLDENRAVLPPLNKRYPVYTFYDDSLKKDKATKEAENELLLIWRRAWWAQGFKPIVLSREEAMQNPLYESIQRMDLKDDLETDLARWLAWGNMGSGILANWLALPMAPYQDSLLVHLRRGEYPPGITTFKPLPNALFYGEKESIDAALKQILQKPANELKLALSVTDLLDSNDLTTEAKADAIGFYDRKTIEGIYKPVADKLNGDAPAEGLQLLGVLINSHLHNTWQNTFSDGVVVLKPLPEHTNVLVEPAVDIALNLTQCPTSPIPTSCPPNRPKCRPCASSGPSEVKFAAHYRNSSTLYTVGTVPHPYTFTSLHFRKDVITARFLRREATKRDMWISTVTQELLDLAVGAESRVVRFKESVAGIHGASHSLWLTAERESHVDLDWIFGFRLPREAAGNDTAASLVPPEARPQAPKPDPAPTENMLQEEAVLLGKARQAIKNKVQEMIQVTEMVEAWNLADTEAWKFARAFSARRRVERQKWEQEEASYAGAERRKSGWGRWFDS